MRKNKYVYVQRDEERMDMIKYAKKSICGLLVCLLLAGLTACTGKGVVGTWTAQQGDTTVTYVFTDDGNGTMDIGSGIVLPITYETDNGKLTLTYSILGIEDSVEYEYVISKKTLTLTKDGSSITLNKQD